MPVVLYKNQFAETFLTQIEILAHAAAFQALNVNAQHMRLFFNHYRVYETSETSLRNASRCIITVSAADGFHRQQESYGAIHL